MKTYVLKTEEGYFGGTRGLDVIEDAKLTEAMLFDTQKSSKIHKRIGYRLFQADIVKVREVE